MTPLLSLKAIFLIIGFGVINIVSGGELLTTLQAGVDFLYTEIVVSEEPHSPEISVNEEHSIVVESPLKTKHPTSSGNSPATSEPIVKENFVFTVIGGTIRDRIVVLDIAEQKQQPTDNYGDDTEAPPAIEKDNPDESMVANGGDDDIDGTVNPLVADGEDDGDPVIIVVRGTGISGTGDPVIADSGDGGIDGTGDPVVADGGDGGIGGTGDPVVADGGNGGIGGTGDPVVAEYSGTITGFGSVFVNGVEFFTSSSSIEIDDEIAIEDDLKLGMLVKIEGEVDSGGITGNAFNIRAEYSLMGIIENDPQVINEDATLKKITILGKTVLIDKYSTVFHSKSDNTASFDYEKIARKDYVRLTGFIDNENNIYATHCENLGVYSRDSSVLSVKGVVSDYGGKDGEDGEDDDEFYIGKLKIEITNETDISSLDEYSLANGMEVKVTGLSHEHGDIHALSIKPVSPTVLVDVPDGLVRKVVEGIVTGLNEQKQTFILNGIFVNYTDVLVNMPNLKLYNQLRVEISGEEDNGIFYADTISFRGGNFEISGIVEWNDLVNNTDTIAVSIVTGQEIIVSVDSRTLINNNNKIRLDLNESLAAIAPGDFVDIKATLDNNGDLVASVIQKNKLFKNSVYRLQGQISCIDRTNHEITIFGTTISLSDFTRFGPAELHVDTVDNFFEIVSVGDVIAVEDARVSGWLYGDGIADKVLINPLEQ